MKRLITKIKIYYFRLLYYLFMRHAYTYLKQNLNSFTTFRYLINVDYYQQTGISTKDINVYDVYQMPTDTKQ